MSVQISDSTLITQIIYLSIPLDQHLDQKQTNAGSQWSEALDLITASKGLLRLYWGRRLEEPEKVQLHLVWEDSHHGQKFLKSAVYHSQFVPIVRRLSGAEEPGVRVRHATLHHQALGDPFGPQLLGHPIGTAIYTGTDVAWQHAWPLWTHIVRHVDGCRGIAGGYVSEPVDDLENGYVVYVAWETVKHHDDYHHTEHF